MKKNPIGDIDYIIMHSAYAEHLFPELLAAYEEEYPQGGRIEAIARLKARVEELIRASKVGVFKFDGDRACSKWGGHGDLSVDEEVAALLDDDNWSEEPRADSSMRHALFTKDSNYWGKNYGTKRTAGTSDGA